jgi:predicted nucleic acid-binding protein
MIVVSDTSPINYLILIDHIQVLPHLFDQVVIPQAVIEELNHERAPVAVRRWASALPEWAVVRGAEAIDNSLKLGPGEREAISLARQLPADLLLLDDWKAWRAAEARGLAVTGTLNLLEAASQQGLVDLAEAFARLQKTSFHVTPGLIRFLLGRQPRSHSPAQSAQEAAQQEDEPTQKPQE